MDQILFVAVFFGAALYAMPVATGRRGALIGLGLALLTITLIFTHQTPALAI